MKKTLLATAIAVAFGLSGHVMANPSITNTATGTGAGTMPTTAEASNGG